MQLNPTHRYFIKWQAPNQQLVLPIKLMEVQEILKWADELVWAQTGKHLDNLQEAILGGACQGQKYSEIAKNYHCSEPHVKKKASLLWRILSEKTGQDINKSNLRSTFQRLQVSCFGKEYATNFVQIEGLNGCSNCTQFFEEAIDKQEDTLPLRRVDLSKDILDLLELYQNTYPEPTPEIEEAIESIELDFLIEDLQKLFKSMKVGAERIREIVKYLRTFSRLDEAEIKEIDIHENLDSTLLILQNRLKSKPSRPAIEIVKE